MDELESILRRLTAETAVCDLFGGPGKRQDDLERPGFYAWWVDVSGAALIASRLCENVSPGIIYVGQAGAERGSSNATTLRSRLGNNHINGKIRNSTLRLSIAAILLEDLNCPTGRDRHIGVEGEKKVSEWMRAHLQLTFAPFADRTRIFEFESQILDRLDPYLNLNGMPRTQLRVALGKRRSLLRGHQSSGLPPSTESMPRAPGIQPRTSAAVTLHVEISDILTAEENCWMSVTEIARQVNDRGFYVKRDRSLVNANQIQARTNKYSNLFERKESQVRLRR